MLILLTHDSVAVHDSVEPVGDGEHRAVPEPLPDLLLDQGICPCVNIGRSRLMSTGNNHLSKNSAAPPHKQELRINLYVITGLYVEQNSTQ